MKYLFWFGLIVLATFFNTMYIQPVVGFYPALVVAFLVGWPIAGIVDYVYPSSK